MGQFRAVSTGIFCVAAWAAAPAFADVSAAQVWQAWVSQYEAYGYEVAVGTEETPGNGLRLRDVVLSQEIEGTSMVVNIPEIGLRERGDGTVEASFSREMNATAETVVEGSAPISMDMVMTQAGTIMIISGVPENLAYDVTMPEFVIEMDQVAVEGETELPTKVWMSLTGGKGTYGVTQDNGQRIASDFEVAGLRLTASGADPESGGTFRMEGNMADLKTVSDAFMPEGIDYQDMTAALAAGMRIGFDMTQGTSNFKIEASDEAGNTVIDSQAQTGTFAMEMSEDALRYATSAQGVTVQVQADAMPFPLSAAMDAMVFDLGMPVTASETPRTFLGKISLEGLTVSDQLWALFDPTGQLPRDPATLTVDLSGEARLTGDLFAAESGGEMPVRVERLDLNTVRLDAVGVKFDGAGALSFDYPEEAPMPTPIGSIDLRLAGANALMGKLTTMGLLPQDQAMFAQMMLGLYARPTGDDELSSTIEFKDGGEILANGQRIQ